MAQKKLPKLDKPSKRAVQYAAKTEAGSKALSELANRNLSESDVHAWRRVSEEHKEIICYRIRGGELLTSVCRSIGVDPNVIRNLAAMDEEFDHALAAACSQGQHAQVERLYEIPYDTTLNDARAKLLSDNIKWIAGRSNRKSYGEHMKVEQDITVQQFEMPTWSFGQSIEGEIIKPEDDPDTEE